MNESLKRLLSGVVYVALLLIATSYSVTSFYILFGIFMLITIYEFCQLVSLNIIFPLLFGALTYCFSTQFKTTQTNDVLLLLATLFVSVKCLHLLFFLKKEAIDTLSKYIYVIGYVIFPFILITKIPFGKHGYNPQIIISIFILIWTNDTFAYIIGSKIGKTPLYPKISPKKTWEGTVGGAICCGLAAVLLSKFLIGKDSHALGWFEYLMVGFIIGVFGTIGDLIESMFKRNAGIKDSGSFMPGHGGFLDRFDAFIFVIPMVFFYIIILRWWV